MANGCPKTRLGPNPVRGGNDFLIDSEPFYKSLVLYVLVSFPHFCFVLEVADRPSPGGVRSPCFGVCPPHGRPFRAGGSPGPTPGDEPVFAAIFVGWVAVLLGIVLERMFRNGLGALGAAAIGFVTQIIAHHLATQGDTMEMMRAVLDSNFWLATHVVTVTVGYSSTFLSGALAIG